MNKKQIIRMISFVLVLVFLLYEMCHLFESSTSAAKKEFNQFYQLEEGTVDAVFVGTSGIDRYWIAAKAYEEYGMTAYTLATNAQPTWCMLSVLKEVETQGQTPKLVIVDMRPFTVGYAKNAQKSENFSRQVIDVLPLLSKTRTEAIERAVEHIEKNNGGEKVDKSSLYIPFLKFHPKWAEDNFTFRKLLDWKSNYLGFYMSKKLSVRQESITVRTEQTNEKKALIETAEKNLYEIIAYCKEKGYELLFVNTPHYLSPHEEGRMNTIEDILEEEGIPYVNYDVVDESVYSLEEDFYNDGHVNYYGAEKFTADFAKYIDENYDLPDRRGDEDVSKDWDGVYDKIKKQIKKWEKKKRS